jgi:hypothetical protein
MNIANPQPTKSYAPHVLIAKVNLTGITIGSRLVYDSDIGDRLTYRNDSFNPFTPFASAWVVLNLEDATNGEYFDMYEAPAVVQPTPVVQPTKPTTTACTSPALYGREEVDKPASITGTNYMDIIKKYLSWWWLPVLVLLPFFGTEKMITGALSYTICGIIGYSIIYLIKFCQRKANTKTK